MFGVFILCAVLKRNEVKDRFATKNEEWERPCLKTMGVYVDGYAGPVGCLSRFVSSFSLSHDASKIDRLTRAVGFWDEAPTGRSTEPHQTNSALMNRFIHPTIGIEPPIYPPGKVLIQFSTRKIT